MRYQFLWNQKCYKMIAVEDEVSQGENVDIDVPYSQGSKWKIRPFPFKTGLTYFNNVFFYSKLYSASISL